MHALSVARLLVGGVAAAWFLMSGPRALADSAKQSRETESKVDTRPTTAARAKPPRHIHAVVYGAKGLPESVRVDLQTSITDGLRDGWRESAAGEGVTIGVPAPAVKDMKKINKALARSDKALVEAKKRVRNLEDGALDLLDWAADDYARYLPELLARDGNANRLVEVYIQTTIANSMAGDTEAATDALQRALVLEPSLDYSAQRFPPQLEDFVVQERLLFDELGKGALSISIQSGSGDAAVFVNGIEQGQAPVLVKNLRAGPTIVAVESAGGEPQVQSVVVEGGKTSILSVELKQATSVLIGPLAGSRGDAGQAQAGKKLRTAAKKLGVDGLVLVLPTVSGRGSSKKVALIVYAYDMRSGALVDRREAEVEMDTPGPVAEQMARELAATVRWKPSVLVVNTGHTSIWKHKYFWPAVGAAAGVIVLAVVVKAATGGLSSGERVVLLPVSGF